MQQNLRFYMLLFQPPEWLGSVKEGGAYDGSESIRNNQPRIAECVSKKAVLLRQEFGKGKGKQEL